MGICLKIDVALHALVIWVLLFHCKTINVSNQIRETLPIDLKMERKQKISEYREILDRTLASPGLSNVESIRKLVQNQLHSSPSEVQEKRVTEASNFLDILRSASGSDFKASKSNAKSPHAWKFKEDNEKYHVIYREGPQGSPFHTIVTEGYIDAPLHIGLCVGWELSLYKKWCPQISFPPFKVLISCCLKNIGIDQQIALIRMKLPWPLSNRVVVVDYFKMEYLEDGLVFVLLNSISDTESDKHMQEFAGDEIPKVKDIVRLGLTGGFAIKRITSNISYDRLVENIDLKLPLAPPSLINFIARQILGSACKLFQKTAESVAKGDEDYGKALEGAVYVRLREALLFGNNG